MLVSALSHPKGIRHEAEHVNALFRAGLDQFHLRKPGQDAARWTRLLQEIRPEYRPRVVVHGHYGMRSAYGLHGIHFSAGWLREGLLSAGRRRWTLLRQRPLWVSATFHSLEGLADAPSSIRQLWLSPVFQTISERSVGTGFDPRELAKALPALDRPVHALGGLNAETAVEARELGFRGVVLQGLLWRAKDPVRALDDVLCALRESRMAEPTLRSVSRSRGA